MRTGILAAIAGAAVCAAAARGEEARVFADKAGRAVAVSCRTEMRAMEEYDRGSPRAAPAVAPFMPAPPPALAGRGAPAGVPRGPAAAVAPRDGGAAAAPPLGISFRGTADDGTVVPPDTNGAVGPAHVAELLNSGFEVFDRGGAAVSPRVTLQAFWSGLGTAPGQPASGVFDPRMRYDQYEDRWVAVSGGNPDGADGTPASWLLAGVSQTGDPAGAWVLHAILVNGGADAGMWADYPTLGLDPVNAVVTANLFSSASSVFVHSDALAIAVASLKGGAPLVEGVDFARFHDPGGLGGFTFQPCATFGQSAATAANYILAEGLADAATRIRRFLALFKIAGAGGAAALDMFGGNFYIEVAPYNFNQAAAAQPGCDAGIDTNDTRLCNAVWRNGKIWVAHSVGIGSGAVPSSPPTRAEIAWYEIDPAGAGAFPGGVPVQQGRVSDPSRHYYFPSIAVNREECVALGFSGSDAATFAGGYYTLRAGADPPGRMQAVALLKGGESAYVKRIGSFRNRWGDFSTTVVDPLDDATFWTLQEYAGSGGGCADGAGSWGTWWGAFACTGMNLPVDLTANKALFSSTDRLDVSADVQRIATPCFPFVRFTLPGGAVRYFERGVGLADAPTPYLGARTGAVTVASPIEGFPALGVSFAGIAPGIYMMEGGAVDATRTTSSDDLVYLGDVDAEALVVR